MIALEGVGTDLTAGDYLSQWLRHARGRLRPKTHEGYRGLIRLYATPGIGEVPLPRLHPLHLQQMYSSLMERGLAGGTVLNLHLVLAQALSQAVRWGLIDRSPAAGASYRPGELAQGLVSEPHDRAVEWRSQTDARSETRFAEPGDGDRRDQEDDDPQDDDPRS